MLPRLNSPMRFMLLQPTIELRGLSIGFEEFASGLGGAKRGADNQAVGGPKTLPGQPCGQLADELPVFLMEPELNRLPDPALGSGGGNAAGGFPGRLGFRNGHGGGCFRWFGGRIGGGLALNRG